MITVAQLIKMLSKFDGGARVLVHGYEYGVDDIVDPVLIAVELEAHPPDEWYAGAHRAVEDGEPKTAVFIGSARDNNPI
jgi:hypothetical protein